MNAFELFRKFTHNRSPDKTTAKSRMLNVYWFKVHYRRGTPHVNIQFASDLPTAYVQECRASIAQPRIMNTKYPRAPQPVAVRVMAMQPPSRAYLTDIDPKFQAYLDEAIHVLDNDIAPQSL